MDRFGWSDPLESEIVLIYRRKGERREGKFLGPVYVLGPNKNEFKHVPRADLPNRSAQLDLTRVPVVGIGGKRKAQFGRVLQFLRDNQGFQGAILLYPGTGNWDLGEGMLFVTSLEVLSGRRVSGGKPEVQLTNYRWLRDGRYVADRCKMLHGKVLETIEAELEQEPGVEAIVKAVAGWSISHRLRDVIAEVSRELHELEGRRVMLTGEQARDMTALVHERLVVKFREAGVRYVRDIPADLTVTAVEIAPELVSERDALGTIEVPGLGRRLPKKQYVSFGFGDQVPAVEFSVEEFRQLESWPFAKVYPVLTELGDTRDQLNCGLRDAIGAPEAERIGKLREFFSRQWLDRQRSSNRPKDEKTTNPLDSDPPATLEPVVWGFDLMTGEEFKAYAALVHSVYGVKGRIVDSGWSIRWYDNAEEAAKADAEARREAESFITARKLEAELTAEAKVDFPVPIPAPYIAPSHTPAEILAMAGFSADQYRVREDVGYWYSPGQVSQRDPYDWEWSEEVAPSGSFARKGEDGVWEVGKSGLQHVLGGGFVGNYRREANAPAVLATLGAGDKIATIQAQLKAELEQSATDYRTTVREFVETLRAESAFACLSRGMQAKLGGLASQSWGTPSIDEAELRTEWAKAEALLRRQSTGAVLVNWGGHFRVMGATGNCQYWVIQQDGTQREPDRIEYRGRYTAEGEKFWRLVGPEEMALTWSKAYTAAPHEFAVAKLPVSGCTAEQLRAVSRIELEISERFYGARGMTGGAPSPEINGGWNLDAKSKPPKIDPTPATPTEPATPAAPASAEQIGDALAALRAKFGKK